MERVQKASRVRDNYRRKGNWITKTIATSMCEPCLSVAATCSSLVDIWQYRELRRERQTSSFQKSFQLSSVLIRSYEQKVLKAIKEWTCKMV
jgi:hypothetical protein